ncbi:hypothetical protein [Acerihabitans arboris]|uniref:Uncharacterized protein n=1 Tax=Acerihabitans arboris TaxID=2691583 RepID=A0A845SP93_9GAMM|nr:hypothetical protein [Acerihabitans arboris]NDL65899.1 hypothetical protein [Acerihabitans arboris]
MSEPNFSYEEERYAIPHVQFNQALLIGDTIEDICNELGRLSHEAIGSDAAFVADDFYGRVRRWDYAPTINAWREENGVTPVVAPPPFPGTEDPE